MGVSILWYNILTPHPQTHPKKLKWTNYFPNIIFSAVLINESILHFVFHSLRKISVRVKILWGGSKYYGNILTRGS